MTDNQKTLTESVPTVSMASATFKGIGPEEDMDVDLMIGLAGHSTEKIKIQN